MYKLGLSFIVLPKWIKTVSLIHIYSGILICYTMTVKDKMLCPFGLTKYILQLQWEYKFIQVPLIMFHIQNAGVVNISSLRSAAVSLPALSLLCLVGLLPFWLSQYLRYNVSTLQQSATTPNLQQNTITYDISKVILWGQAKHL